MDQSLRFAGAAEPAIPPGLLASPVGGASLSRSELGRGLRTAWEDASGTQDGVGCDEADDEDEVDEEEESLMMSAGGELLGE